MSMFRDLGLENDACGRFRRLQAETQGTFLPRFGPPEGNIVRSDCLGLISMGCYKGKIALARKAKAIVGYVFWLSPRVPLLALYRWPGLKVHSESKYRSKVSLY